ncbi:hypothetical protein Erwinia_phage_Fougasse_00049 [Erwinia phage Fougasse]|nr:hypothetical protein Erwinia_phage_Calisson_00036 [Erwinia phage Calisson]WJN64012.1 hypothetical protein Erwinia_phage_Fougasse_00049 [Erwinia phage Fougasse]WJN64245.1 hypothetical protein Erwinia_phage_Nougat_00049 [Erwinia phage Nougat]WJN64281.1 hypothetical protein Erwinia_phage_Orgeat_00006 [Erwinia phage Orgeat]
MPVMSWPSSVQHQSAKQARNILSHIFGKSLVHKERRRKVRFLACVGVFADRPYFGTYNLKYWRQALIPVAASYVEDYASKALVSIINNSGDYSGRERATGA